ncbi:chlorophyll A-B-binding protein [Nodosilinea sp. P-1105]|nr:chlorophyll A-B-binding protein [Nodosilinea sp. P-1105]
MSPSPEAAPPDSTPAAATDPVTPEVDTPEYAPDAAAEPQAGGAPGFGWVPYAERINGRFAMVGFVALLLLELITGQDFFTWLGLR